MYDCSYQTSPARPSILPINSMINSFYCFYSIPTMTGVHYALLLFTVPVLQWKLFNEGTYPN